MNVYFLSGLGADYRLFTRIVLPEKYHIIHLDWIRPERNEKMNQYANRLSQSINTDENFALVGVSLGGMMAMELSQIVSPKHLIIISSAANRNQLPFYFKWNRYINLHRFIPLRWFKQINVITLWLFGVSDIEEKKLLKQILNDTDENFLKWGINAIIHWDFDKNISGYIQIHGNCDRLLPGTYSEPDLILEGGHLIVFSQADKISAYITKVLNNE